MKAAVKVLQQADILKNKLEECKDIYNDNETRTYHQQLQNLYRKVLLLDLEYALDRKVEQDLWNYIFKNQINILQTYVKDKKLNNLQNAKRAENLSCLHSFLELASGFYLQLLQELCSAFELDLPFQRKNSIFGLSKVSQSFQGIIQPQKSSCYYICQYCLVHLGDIARYRNQSAQSESFYRHAVNLSPSSGQPYNQLAILEAAKGDKLSTIFYYVRSIAVKHPFHVAANNLDLMFNKIVSEKVELEDRDKLNYHEYIQGFLCFHANLHIQQDLSLTSNLLKILSNTLSPLVALETVSVWKLVQMVAISLYSLHKTSGKMAVTEGEASTTPCESVEPLTPEPRSEAQALSLEFLASFLNGLLLPVYTHKTDSHMQDYYALPPIKLLLDWIRTDSTVLDSPAFSNRPQIWPSLCRLLNGLQPCLEHFEMTKYVDVPLPEDLDLQGFLPLHKVLRNFRKRDPSRKVEEDIMNKIRASRISGVAKWLCKQEIGGRRLLILKATTEVVEFEPSEQVLPSSDLIRQLEELQVNKDNRPSSPVLSEISTGQSTPDMGKDKGLEMPSSDLLTDNSLGIIKRPGILKPQNLGDTPSDNKVSVKDEGKQKPKLVCQPPAGRKVRQNVVLQTIMKKSNISPGPGPVDEANRHIKPEGKQVTFKTPSPSPSISPNLPAASPDSLSPGFSQQNQSGSPSSLFWGYKHSSNQFGKLNQDVTNRNLPPRLVNQINNSQMSSPLPNIGNGGITMSETFPPTAPSFVHDNKMYMMRDNSSSNSNIPANPLRFRPPSVSTIGYQKNPNPNIYGSLNDPNKPFIAALEQGQRPRLEAGKDGQNMPPFQYSDSSLPFEVRDHPGTPVSQQFSSPWWKDVSVPSRVQDVKRLDMVGHVPGQMSSGVPQFFGSGNQNYNFGVMGRSSDTNENPPNMPRRDVPDPVDPSLVTGHRGMGPNMPSFNSLMLNRQLVTTGTNNPTVVPPLMSALQRPVTKLENTNMSLLGQFPRLPQAAGAPILTQFEQTVGRKPQVHGMEPRIENPVLAGNMSTYQPVSSTYSLFSSPNIIPQFSSVGWKSPSGPNVAPNQAKGAIPGDASHPAMKNLTMQSPQQSLWGGFGSSPLERLLEQQKQKKDSLPTT